MKTHDDLKRDLVRIYRAAIAAVDPALLTGRALEGRLPESDAVRIAMAQARRILVLAIGKASRAMAEEIRRRAGERIAEGILVVPPSSPPASPLRGFRQFAGGHPLPNQSSIEAAHAALEVAAKAGPGDLLLVALSGGASAMFAAPAGEVTLEDKIAVTSALLRSGASIRELNCVRKHLSAVKGGRLAAALGPRARLVSLIISDVPGDDIATIGSGPTAPDPTTFADAIAVLKRRRIWGRAPERVRDHLERGVAGEIPETPGGDDPSLARVCNLIVGGNRTALDAAAEEARRMNLIVERGRELTGEADQLGREFAARIAELRGSPTCLIAGGEPVVTVRGGGRGGRAQHCALSIAMEFANAAPGSSAGVLVAGTDGIDGPTDAAGAFAFADSAARMRAKGVDPETASRRNDAYNALDAIGDLFRPGPTGTNVADLIIALSDC